jgi:hypothetical protein
MTGQLDVFLIKQLRRQAQINQLKELLKPLADCYDSDVIWVSILGPVSIRIPERPNIDQKTSPIPIDTEYLPMLKDKTIYCKGWIN